MRSLKRRLLVIACFAALALVALFVLIHSLEHNVVTKADSLLPGMSTNEVLKIMGAPKRVSTNFGPLALTEWHYDAPGQSEFSFSLRPLKLSTWQRDWITINVKPDGNVLSVWIPSSD